MTWPLAAQTGAADPEARLAPLPKPPDLTVPRPEREDRERLDLLLGKLTSADAAGREAALHELPQGAPKWVPAIAERRAAIASDADRDAMKRLLGDTRRRARDRVRDNLRSEGRRDKVVTPDYLEILLSQPKPDSKAWRDLVCVVAMSRMLVEAGTVDSVRELIEVYVRFGEFLRADTQLQLEKLGDKALPALIEARRHEAEKIARWAERQLDALGKAVPGEAVQTTDPEVLADVLRAYGRIRDPDAARIVVTFANSERGQVREAARQAVVLMGEVAQWQLRDTYENFVGQRPPRDWSWERMARELFDRFDRQRLAQVYGLFEQGKKAERAKKFEEMRAAFDRVLAQNPGFDRRAEMAQGYLEYARSLPPDKRAEALVMVRRVERIASGDDLRKTATSLRLTLEAEDLLTQGVVDQTLLRRAMELDPGNHRARDTLGRRHGGEQNQTALYRYLAAAVIALVALASIVGIGLGLGLRRDRRHKDKTGAPADQGRAAVEENEPGAGQDRLPAANVPAVEETESGAGPRRHAGGHQGPSAPPDSALDPMAPQTGRPPEEAPPGTTGSAQIVASSEARPSGATASAASVAEDAVAESDSPPNQPVDPIGELLGETSDKRRRRG